MGQIYVVRHGQTVANRDRTIQGPRIDAELSDLGIQQADSLAKAMSQLPIGALYSSPLLRARQTAEAVAVAHQVRVGPARTLEAALARDPADPLLPMSPLPPRDQASPAPQAIAPQIVPELYEMDYGQFTGRTYDDVADEMEQVLDAWRMGYVDEPFPGGESPVLAQHRLRPFMSRLVQQASHGDVAVVAHGRINRVLIASLTGAGLSRLEEFPQSNASITQLEAGPGKVVVRRLNDTAHLGVVSDAFS